MDFLLKSYIGSVVFLVSVFHADGDVVFLYFD